jgi:hypothetical protein
MIPAGCDGLLEFLTGFVPSDRSRHARKEEGRKKFDVEF